MERSKGGLQALTLGQEKAKVNGLLLLSLNPSTKSGAQLRDKAEFQKLGGHRVEERVKRKCCGRAWV